MSMVRWTERAATDLLAIGDYIAVDKPAAARAWVERLRECAANIAETPRAGRVVPELGRDDVREGIVVLTVFEGHRLFGALDPDAGE